MCYSGANEVNVDLATIRNVCRELRDQVDEECLTFSYDDLCGLAVRDKTEIQLLNKCIRRHPRLRYFECLMRSAPKLRALLAELELPPTVQCSFLFEFKASVSELRELLQRFAVRRLSVMLEEGEACVDLPKSSLRVLCLRSCDDEGMKALLTANPKLQALQIMDSRLQRDTVIPQRLTSLSLTAVSMPDEQFSSVIAGCLHLRSLYVAKCHISNMVVALPHLELLSITHCRQLTDQCVNELVRPASNPRLRYIDLTEDKSLVSPVLTHPGLEIAWLMHCPQLTDQAVSQMFQGCPSLTAANLVQSSVEYALISSANLRTLELTTSQKLSDAAVTHLLEHCPSLTFLDVGHCCQLVEPRLQHATLDTILLSFCVNLRESAVVGLFEGCPSLRYVEIAVCMFDMTRFQRECGPGCQVVVNFDF